MVRLMLYKKIHRQFLREFRIGRKFKYSRSGDVCEVTGKPLINRDGIVVEVLEIRRSSRYSRFLINERGRRYW